MGQVRLGYVLMALTAIQLQPGIESNATTLASSGWHASSSPPHSSIRAGLAFSGSYLLGTLRLVKTASAGTVPASKRNFSSRAAASAAAALNGSKNSASASDSQAHSIA